MADRLTPKQRSAIARANHAPELQLLLFKQAKGLQWYWGFKESGLIDPRMIPRPAPAKQEGYVTIPVWPITEYLASASAELERPGTENEALEFVAFVSDATIYAKSTGIFNYRVWWNFAKILANVPPTYISTEDAKEWVSYWLSDPFDRGLVASHIGSWLERLLSSPEPKAHSLSIALLDLLYTPAASNADSKSSRSELIVDAWHIREITRKVAKAAGQRLGPNAIRLLKARLENLLVHTDDDHWSAMWRPAIEDHEQNSHRDDGAGLLIEALRDTLLGYLESDATPDEIVREMLTSSFETIRRVGIYSVDAGFPKLKSLVPMATDPANLKSNLRHELWNLLNHRYPFFSRSDREHVVATISSIVIQSEEDPAGVNEAATAYQRAIWLSAIKDFDTAVERLYLNATNIAEAEPEHPSFSSYMSVGWGDDESPIEIDVLAKLTTEQLVLRLNDYEDSKHPLRPGIRGLTKTVRSLVKSDPLRFLGDLPKLTRLKLPYLYEVIEAYSDLLSTKAQIPWPELWPSLLAFFYDIVATEDFWSRAGTQRNQSFVANRYWIVASICRTIEAGLRSETQGIPTSSLDIAETTLRIILEKEEPEDFKDTSDAVSVAINSPRGQCIEALILLAYEESAAKSTKEARVDVWARFESLFEDELSRGDRGEYEFATLVTNHLQFFLYLSSDWLVRSLPRIFDTGNDKRWICAMQGYAYVTTVYESVYQYLRGEGLLFRALNDARLKDQAHNKIIQQIAVAFLNSMESLNDPQSAISIVIQRAKMSELSELIWFLWLQRDSGDPAVTSKVFALWDRLLPLADGQTKEGRQIASKLCQWISFVTHVDLYTEKLIGAVVPFAEEDYHGYVVIEAIGRISETQPDAAYRIWRRLLEASQCDFPPEDVQKAFSNIVAQGPEGVRQAKEIADAYLKRGLNDQPIRWLQTILDKTSASAA